MTKPIAIFGAGGLGREVLALIQSLSQWHVVGFFDDNVKPGTIVNGIEVLGDRTSLLNWPDQLSVILAIGLPARKLDVDFFLKSSSNLSYPILIHPSAVILNADRVTMGEGTILSAGCIITTDVQIGRHVLINLNVTIGHDSTVADYASIMPGVNLAGAVKVEEAVLIGSGANILGEVVIGKAATVGAGAVVNRDVKQHVTAVGVPARAIVKKS